MADQLTDAANVETCRMLNQAQTKCEHFLSDAGAKAGNMVDEAPVRAETMLHDARATVGALERQSRERVALLEQDATRRHIEVLDALSQQKRLLEKISTNCECSRRSIKLG
jgi:ElaB/YqjD/DUF883 family membrane-anchored ribosome-binding protein